MPRRLMREADERAVNSANISDAAEQARKVELFLKDAEDFLDAVLAADGKAPVHSPPDRNCTCAQS